MQATTATLLAALSGFTALSLAACDAHTLTARLPGASSTGPTRAGAGPDTAAATATARAPSAAGASAPDSDAADAAARERAREKGCDEPAGCYYGVRLVGYPLEEARRRVLEYGFQGEIDVKSDRMYAGCKRGTVCGLDPNNWPTQDNLTLYVNYVPGELKINKPE